MAWKIGLKRMIELSGAGSASAGAKTPDRKVSGVSTKTKAAARWPHLSQYRPISTPDRDIISADIAAKTGSAQGSAGAIGHASMAPASTTPPVTRPLSAPA